MKWIDKYPIRDKNNCLISPSNPASLVVLCTSNCSFLFYLSGWLVVLFIQFLQLFSSRILLTAAASSELEAEVDRVWWYKIILNFCKIQFLLFWNKFTQLYKIQHIRYNLEELLCSCSYPLFNSINIDGCFGNVSVFVFQEKKGSIFKLKKLFLNSHSNFVAISDSGKWDHGRKP